MKPEPLKGKRMYQIYPEDEGRVFYDKSVLSAVEWLKLWQLLDNKNDGYSCDCCGKKPEIIFVKPDSDLTFVEELPKKCRCCLYYSTFVDVVKDKEVRK